MYKNKKEFKNELDLLDPITIYKEVLLERYIKKFPNGFWQKPEALENAKICTKYLLEDILKLSDEQIKTSYLSTIFRNNGLIRVRLDRKYGYINRHGKEIIPCIYDYCYNYIGEEGLIKVRVNDKWGFINKRNKKAIPFIYDWCSNFDKGIAIVKIGYKYGLINKRGKEITPCKYEDHSDFIEGLIRVKLNDKYGFINRQGKEVIPCIYDWCDPFNEDGLSEVLLDNKWGCINKQGIEVIPCKYEEVISFSNGLGKIKLDNKYGYINKEGKEIIPCKYDWCDLFNEEIFVVRVDWKPDAQIKEFVDKYCPDYINKIEKDDIEITLYYPLDTRDLMIYLEERSMLIVTNDVDVKDIIENNNIEKLIQIYEGNVQNAIEKRHKLDKVL